MTDEDLDKANGIIENALLDYHNNKEYEEDNENRKYSIYIHTNKTNGKKYVGQTGQEPSYRWGKNGRKYTEKHKGKTPSTYFSNAIIKHGWDAFYHDVLRSNLTKEEADILEIALIEGFDSTNRDKGYNLTTGGHRGGHSQETKEKLRQINLGRYVSPETRKKNGLAHKGLKRTKESIEKGRQKIRKARGVHVLQYDKNGKLIKQWDYKVDASRELGIRDSSISDCCAGRVKTAGGYIWRNIDEPLTQEHLKWCTTNGTKEKRKIVRFTTDMKFVDKWVNGADAQRATGISHILCCCHYDRKTAGGYIWRFEDDESIQRYLP